MANEIKLTGFKEFEAKLKTLPGKLTVKADGVVQESAGKWAKLAKRSAPKNFGQLSGEISASRVKSMEAEVISPKDYSAYMEWGTGKKVSVPSDMTNYALQFKGKKEGNGDDFLKAILDWVKRKGIGATYNVSTRRKNKQTKDDYLAIAQAIARSIYLNGINPQPFFFIHKDNIEKELYAKLNEIVNTPL